MMNKLQSAYKTAKSNYDAANKAHFAYMNLWDWAVESDDLIDIYAEIAQNKADALQLSRLSAELDNAEANLLEWAYNVAFKICSTDDASLIEILRNNKSIVVQQKVINLAMQLTN